MYVYTSRFSWGDVQLMPSAIHFSLKNIYQQLLVLDQPPPNGFLGHIVKFSGCVEECHEMGRHKMITSSKFMWWEMSVSYSVWCKLRMWDVWCVNNLLLIGVFSERRNITKLSGCVEEWSWNRKATTNRLKIQPACIYTCTRTCSFLPGVYAITCKIVFSWAYLAPLDNPRGLMTLDLDMLSELPSPGRLVVSLRGVCRERSLSWVCGSSMKNVWPVWERDIVRHGERRLCGNRERVARDECKLECMMQVVSVRCVVDE